MPASAATAVKTASRVEAVVRHVRAVGPVVPADLNPWMVSDLDGFRNPGAANSFLTSPNVRSLLEKRGVERYQDDASVLKWREMPSMAAARAYGPIELAAASYTGEHADCLGAYELQEEMVEGRPTYRQKTGLRWYLFYATNRNWMIGPDTSKPAALWTVASEAETPDAITEQWSVCDGGDGWDPVVVVVTSGQATAAVAATAAMEDDAAVGEDGGMQGGGGGGGGGVKRHDDRKPLHSAAKIGTQRQNAAHNAAQVHSLRQFVTSAAGLLWLALRLRRLPRFPRRQPESKRPADKAGGC